jgi:hypothetical protein
LGRTGTTGLRSIGNSICNRHPPYFPTVYVFVFDLSQLQTRSSSTQTRVGNRNRIPHDTISTLTFSVQTLPVSNALHVTVGAQPLPLRRRSRRVSTRDSTSPHLTSSTFRTAHGRRVFPNAAMLNSGASFREPLRATLPLAQYLVSCCQTSRSLKLTRGLGRGHDDARVGCLSAWRGGGE